MLKKKLTFDRQFNESLQDQHHTKMLNKMQWEKMRVARMRSASGRDGVVPVAD